MILDSAVGKERLFLGMGAVSGFVGVAAGAFGAHALKARLAADLLAVFETGVRYQMYHAFALIAVALLVTRRHGRAAPAAGWLFAIGTVLFSGSLYVLALTGVRAWRAVTPFGGVVWLAAWASLALSARRRRSVVIEIEEDAEMDHRTIPAAPAHTEG